MLSPRPLQTFCCWLMFMLAVNLWFPPATYAAEAVQVSSVEPGNGRVMLVLSPHADDATLFIGGTVAAWTDAGWRVVVARVTDDRWDSVGLSEADTLVNSAAEFRAAMAILGVRDVIDLGFQTDVLGDADRLRLRERIIWLIRTWKPFAVATIDPYSGTGEDNQDHVVVAEATAEALWTAQFDKHHPEHFKAGLTVHGVVEHWYFGRPVREVTDVIDVSGTIDRKFRAALAHVTPLRNIVAQLRMQARTAGYTVPALEAAQAGDLSALVHSLVIEPAKARGKAFGVGAVESFRVVRFGGNMEWLGQNGVPIDAATGTATDSDTGKGP
jgi:N-acetylglucosamine malate deacetylase 1